MRTAMEELINEIVKNNVEINFAPYLEKEKQQIVDAYIDGLTIGCAHDSNKAIAYYNETFKTEQVK